MKHEHDEMYDGRRMGTLVRWEPVWLYGAITSSYRYPHARAHSAISHQRHSQPELRDC